MSPPLFRGRQSVSAHLGLGLLAAAALLVGLLAAPSGPTPASSPGSDARGDTRKVHHAKALLQELADRLDETMAGSRSLLLGQRDPDGPACLQPRLRNGRLDFEADPTGGIGTRLVALYARMPASPKAAFDWRQGPLRRELARARAQNRLLAARAEGLWRKSRDLTGALGSSPLRARGLQPPPDGPAAHWPGHCLAQLTRAARRGDAAAGRQWADELAAAAFALADLHRWTELLLANQLLMLDFQARCEEAFAWADVVYDGSSLEWECRLPASDVLTVFNNCYEVERQSHWLFRRPPSRRPQAAPPPPAARPAVSMPPDLREAFLTVRGRLSPATRTLWDHAARTELEHSYLVNMLFRASGGKALDELSVVLRRFERAHPAPALGDMMDVLFYRAGMWSSGYDWADRYDARLMREARRLAGGSEETLRQAHALTRGMFDDWDNYVGYVATLREALDRRQLDCVRGTDMIGSLFRNAGRSGYYAVRLSCGTAGHSSSAAAVPAPAGPPTLAIVDPLADGGPAAWPSAFFRGHRWPDDYPGPRGPTFAAEVYLRGLDDYLFAEGYVVRGAHAGLLVRSAMPHLTGRRSAAAERVYDGPYPATPAPPRRARQAPSAPPAREHAHGSQAVEERRPAGTPSAVPLAVPRPLPPTHARSADL